MGARPSCDLSGRFCDPYIPASGTARPGRGLEQLKPARRPARLCSSPSPGRPPLPLASSPGVRPWWDWPRRPAGRRETELWLGQAGRGPPLGWGWPRPAAHPHSYDVTSPVTPPTFPPSPRRAVWGAAGRRAASELDQPLPRARPGLGCGRHAHCDHCGWP